MDTDMGKSMGMGDYSEILPILPYEKLFCFMGLPSYASYAHKPAVTDGQDSSI